MKEYYYVRTHPQPSERFSTPLFRKGVYPAAGQTGLRPAASPGSKGPFGDFLKRKTATGIRLFNISKALELIGDFDSVISTILIVYYTNAVF